MKRVNVEIEIPDGMEVVGTWQIIPENINVKLRPITPRTMNIELEEVLDSAGCINKGDYYTDRDNSHPVRWGQDSHKFSRHLMEVEKTIVWKVKK